MNRIKVNASENPNFIGCWNINNDKLCDNIIQFFENSTDLQVAGTTGAGVNTNIKKSTDIVINPIHLKEQRFSMIILKIFMIVSMIIKINTLF